MKLYTTNEVSEATGATLRQLQYLDDNGHVVPSRGWVGKKPNARLYSADQIRQIKRMMDIRSTFRLHLREIPPSGKVRIITIPTEINGVLIIPKRRANGNGH